MMLEHEHGIYPPRLKISNRSRGSAQNLTISFSNVQEGSDLDMELIHPPSMLLHDCTYQLYNVVSLLQGTVSVLLSLALTMS